MQHNMDKITDYDYIKITKQCKLIFVSNTLI